MKNFTLTGFLLALTISAPAAAQTSFAPLIKEVAPAVVNINVTQTVTLPILPGFTPFNNLETPEQQSAGSGFLIQEDGLIVTNHHVIENASAISIEMLDGETYDATIVASDPLTDIAIIDIDGNNHPTVSFGNSDGMEVGDWVIAIGNPLGQGFSASAGIVSARERTLTGAFDDYIQTDAAINRGNSGGPLFNLDGKVVGVNTAILSPTGGSIGLGFAVSSNVANQVIAQLQKFGETRRGWMGVRIQPLTQEMKENMGVEEDGVILSEIIDGPAQEAGLKAGDIILQINAQTITSPLSLTKTVGNLPPETVIEIVFLRNSEKKTTQLTLGQREEAETRLATTTTPAQFSGTTFDTSSENTAQVIVRSIEEGSLYDGVLKEGMVVLSANREQVRTPQALVRLLTSMKEAGRKNALAQVSLNDTISFITIPLE